MKEEEDNIQNGEGLIEERSIDRSSEVQGMREVRTEKEWLDSGVVPINTELLEQIDNGYKDDGMKETSKLTGELIEEPTPDSSIVFRQAPLGQDRGRDVIRLNPAHGITSQRIHELANPKKLTYEGSRLKSSSPPLTPDQIEPEIDKQKELIGYMDKFKDLPINWPYCSISRCAEPAHWSVQKNMNDPKSPMGFLCGKCFTLLPYAPLDPYRVYKLSVNNYQRLVQLSIDLGGATSLINRDKGVGDEPSS